MQKKFKTHDNREYTLWSNVHEAVEVAMTYHSETRDKRQKRGWLFRGQANADWLLVPTLYRDNPGREELNKRLQRTYDFINALKRNPAQQSLANLTDRQFLAIAQHYGLPTNLLDFTYNVEVAAYFASGANTAGEVGVIYCISRQRYEELASFLPLIVSYELSQIPRIYSQEGVFIECSMTSAADLHEECIDRFYFIQDPQRVYRGGAQPKTWMLPSRDDCDSEETYQAIINTLREEKPHLFERTPHMSGWRVFPPEDSISQIANQFRPAGSQAKKETKRESLSDRSSWQKLLEDIEMGRVASVDAIASRFKYSDELAAILEKVEVDTRDQIIMAWQRLPHILLRDYVQPSFEQGVPAKWIGTLCEELVAAWSLDFVLKAENNLERESYTPKSWEPFAARLWGMKETEVTEFDFETSRPNRIYFRSAIPLNIVGLVIRRALPELLEKVHIDPSIKSDLLSFDNAQILAGPYIQLTGMLADRFLRFLSTEERYELWYSCVVPIGAVFILGQNRPFLNPDSVYRCGFP